MVKIVAVTSYPSSITHAFMAAEALEQTALNLGHSIRVETHGPSGTRNALTESEIAQADVVIISASVPVDRKRFQGKPIFVSESLTAITDAASVIQQALDAQSKSAMVVLDALPEVVAITSCPTGIAHTFMAAEGLELGAKKLGKSIKVETQGSVGAQNTLTPEEIEAAKIVLIAADTNIDKSRFAGKRIYETSTNAAITDGAAVVRNALERARVQTSASSSKDFVSEVEQAKNKRSATRSGPYKHLMTGVSHMIPFVVAGGLLITLGFSIGGIYVYQDQFKNTLGQALFIIGAKNAFFLMVPILAGFIAHSIADRPGLAPGMIGGLLAASGGSGFLGGIVAGFLAGYTVKYLNLGLKLPRGLQGLKPVLLLPLLGSAIVGLLMIYVIGGPVAYVLKAITSALQGLSGTNAALLGLLLGAMMALDMGGPVNKAAYTFATGLLASNVFAPMAAVMAAGMTPPLGLALATLLFKNRFSPEERGAGASTAILGIAFITEGAIPFAAKDPMRVIPSLMLGSAVTGALSMALGCEVRAPHGGAFVLPMVTHRIAYLVILAVGSVVTAGALFVLKRPAAMPIQSEKSVPSTVLST